MMPTLAIYQYTHNCLKIDYPFIESIQSALLVADRVFVCDCESTDGTWERLQAMAATDNRIEVMKHPWGDHYRIQGQVCNGIIEGIGTHYDFALQLQADEIICEWTIAPFRRDLDAIPGGMLGRPRYRHFCPDYRTTWPFIYERKAVLHRTLQGCRYDPNSDACSLPGHSFYDCSLEIHHIGKVQLGREKQALDKELEFQKLYASLGFPDAKFLAQRDRPGVDYREAFADAVFTSYHGPHPSVLLPRVMKAEGRWFNSNKTYRDIPGWFDFEDLYEQVVNDARTGALFVEIGAWLGRSTAFMAAKILASKKQIDFHVVDTWEGSPNEPHHVTVAEAHGGNIFSQFRDNMEVCGVWSVVKPIKMKSVVAASRFSDGSLDFVFIDADHSKESVRADIQTWLPKVRAGGLLAGHDYKCGHPGVDEAVDALLPVKKQGSCWLWRVG